MCLAIPGKIVESLAEDASPRALVDVVGVRRRVDLGLLEGRHRSRRLGADPRRLRHEQDQRSRTRSTRCACSPCWARPRPPWRKCEATAWTMPTCTRRSDLPMKFVDEFREPELITRTAEEIRRLADPGAALPPHGSVRRPHARHLPLRPEGPAAAQHRTDPRPRLPGVRAADGPHRRRAVDGRAARRHLHRLRRHDARARHARQSARAQGARRRCAHRLLAGRRAEAGAGESRQARDVLRHRLRDHRALHRADADAREGRGHPQLLGLLQPRHDHSRDSRDSRFAGHAHRRVHRTGPRLHRDRLPALRVDRAQRRQADRGLRLRAARYPAIDRDAAAPAAAGRGRRSRTSTSAWCRGKAIAPR